MNRLKINQKRKNYTLYSSYIHIKYFAIITYHGVQYEKKILNKIEYFTVVKVKVIY